MHFAAIGWKVFFALIPPARFMHGWVAFVVALFMIGFVTAIVGEVATLFGCVIGLKQSITAITFVALGTSLPDTFASMTAAQEADTADAAVGNVTGSNSVNVFLGLGLPWMIGAIYDNGKYEVPSGPLGFSVLIFMIAATACIILLVVRRKVSFDFLFQVVGGELGGSKTGKWASCVFCVSLWLFYIIMSILQNSGIIESPL